MSGSNSNIHGGRHGEEKPPVARVELHQMANSFLEAMERMLNARMPADRRRAPRHQYDESGGENSDARHDRFRDDCGGGRRASHRRRDGGRAHGRGRDHRVRLEDEESDDFDHEEGFGDNENPFANDGLFGQHQDRHRCADHEDRDHHHGCHNRDDSDSIAHVKFSIPKFTRREDANAYLE